MVRKGRDRWRTKEWYDVIAPPMFASRKIGETPASDPKQIPGRVMEKTLGELIDDFSKSHVKLYFKMKEPEGKKIPTEFVGHDMAREYIRSQVRRRITKVDCIVDVVTSDGRKLRVTAMAISFRRIRSSHVASIRRGMRETIIRRAKKLSFDQFVQEVVLGKLSSDIYKEIRNICPIKQVEVQKTKVLQEPS